MLTPQDVSTRSFAKAVMGGYNMAMVDEFLDEVTDDYTALYKENAALKAKMKVLVEKVEEYRSTEDSMRATLLTAQRMADSIIQEAEQKKERIIADAEVIAQQKIHGYSRELAEAEERLRQGQVELARFIATTRELCNQELRFLDQLPQAPVSAPVAAPAAEYSVEEIEENVMAAFAFRAQEDAREQEEAKAAAEEAAAEPEEETEPAEEKSEDPFGTRRIDLNDLRFGRNYSRNKD